MRILKAVAAGATLAVTGIATSIAIPALAETATQTIPANPALDAALADKLRGEDGKRDVHRHPRETLTFFDVRPGMTVVDYMPASGWYSRVLIPYLGGEGTYVALNPKVPADATGFMANMRDTGQRFPVQAREWVPAGGAKVVGANADTVPDELAGKADRFLIFREIHNMRRLGWLHETMIAARKLLKDDGLLGVVQHRAKADAPFSYTDGSKGYQREQDVIALMGAYGFELVARSEINANPRDPADWEGGVWTLPPSNRGAGEGVPTRAELEAIGESDRMTLLFRKRP